MKIVKTDFISPKTLSQRFRQDSMFRNSVFLMLSTGIQAICGFFFWLLCARLYTPQEIGIGSVLISAATFIAYLSLLGFNSSLIRFLPKSTRRSQKINSSLILVFIFGLFASSAYIILLPFIAREISFVSQNFLFSFLFITLSAMGTANLLTDSIFVAYRSARYNLIVYTIQSLTKLILPLTLVALGSFGIFASSGLAAGIALFLSIFFLVKNFQYKPKFEIDSATIKPIWKFSSANYISNIFNILPTIIIPIIILNKLGAEQAGYYYLAFMIANLLYSVVYAVSQSFFAEGSYEEAPIRKLFTKALLMTIAMIIPAGILLILFGPIILQLFGKSYSNEASGAIIMLAVAAPTVALYDLFGMVLRIKNKTNALIAMNLVYFSTITILTFFWAEKGISWIATSWGIGNFVSALFAFSVILLGRKHQ